jgi:hypothetical protein
MDPTPTCQRLPQQMFLRLLLKQTISESFHLRGDREHYLSCNIIFHCDYSAEENFCDGEIIELRSTKNIYEKAFKKRKDFICVYLPVSEIIDFFYEDDNIDICARIFLKHERSPSNETHYGVYPVDLRSESIIDFDRSLYMAFFDAFSEFVSDLIQVSNIGERHKYIIDLCHF